MQEITNSDILRKLTQAEIIIKQKEESVQEDNRKSNDFSSYLKKDNNLDKIDKKYTGEV